MQKNNAELLTQYELMVNSATQVTTWRQTTNGFYLTVNTALLAIITYFYGSATTAGRIIIPLIGIVVSAIWHQNIDYFCKLNKAKFEVIHEIEKNLPIAMFKLEHEYYKKENTRNATQIEKGIPYLFAIAYMLVFLFQLIISLYSSQLAAIGLFA